ncbi:MAG TPA: endopeptidase La [Gemmatimonadota bacterium]|nr:endopeptidase La [Gemmatimonadota bacterium]
MADEERKANENEQAGAGTSPEEASPDASGTVESPGPGEITVDLSSIPDRLPVLTLRDGALYPYTVIPLAVAEPALISAVDAAMRGQRMVAVVALRDAVEEGRVPAREDLHDIGTVAIIHRMVRSPQAVRILLQGIARCSLVSVTSTESHIEARILVLSEPTDQLTERGEALLREGQELASQVIRESSFLPDELQTAVRRLDQANQFVYMVASMIHLDDEKRQRVLASGDPEERLELVVEGLRRELNVIRIGGEIRSQVDEEIQKKQREYYLREQLKAIQEELGEGPDEGAEAERLRKCLVESEVPDYVMEAAEEQLERLTSVPPASPEYSVIVNYVDWLCTVPWTRSTEDRLDLGHARTVLDTDHYDLKEIKDRILEYFAVLKLKQDLKGPILCFVGPPGVGKTSLGKSIARALGREFVRMSLGGLRDEAEIRGHRRTYIGAMPGRIVQSLKRVGVNNPVFMLDEIDKVGADFRGDPSSALLEVLDPEQNDSFRDHYLDLPLDLSSVLFIATANVLETIQPALLDRMETIRLPGYTDPEKLHIARDHLIPKQLSENGLEPGTLDITDAAIERIINGYTREAGVRNLEREIAKIARKVAAKVASGEEGPFVVDHDDVPEYLGAQKAYHEVARRTAQPGVATALAWTPAGGEILFVEATTMPGSKGFVLTGQLGAVMQESARAALGYIRSHATELGIPADFFDKFDIHLHVPAGATPKDGPSAGVTMAAALASALTGRPIRPEVAMTGEITLTGQVLPVGGIKEKLVAARRSEIRTVILPARNREHVAEVEPELVEGLEFVFAETIGDVLRAALSEPPAGGRAPATPEPEPEPAPEETADATN